MGYTPHHFTPGQLIQAEPFNQLEAQVIQDEATMDTKVPKTTKVNGKALSDDISLDKTDIGLGNVDNTSDRDKPISTAVQEELDEKVPSTRKVNGYTLDYDVSINKSDVGLGNVDNTSDLNKPVSTATQTALDNKVDKVTGKGLSTNDYTTTEKTKLAGISEGAEVNVQSDWNQTNTSADDYIKNKPNLVEIDDTTTSSTEVWSSQKTSNELDSKVDIETGKGLSTNDYTTEEKTKLAGIETGATKITVDSTISSTSTNPVQNKVIHSALSQKINEPTIEGTNGQVLSTTGNGGRRWVTVQTESDIDDSSTSTSKTWSSTKISNQLTDKIDEPESEGTNGQVLSTDGNGGRTWISPYSGSSVGIYKTTLTFSNTGEIDTTIVDSSVNQLMYVLEWSCDVDDAQGSDWNITTADGSYRFVGTVNTAPAVLTIVFGTNGSDDTNGVRIIDDNTISANKTWSSNKINNELSVIEAVVGKLDLTWAAVQLIVQSGNAQKYFKIGDELSCNYKYDNVDYEWVWCVADFRNVEKENRTIVPGMILQSKYCSIESIVFDSPEKVEAVEETAQEGIYYYGLTGETVHAPAITLLDLSVGASIPYSSYNKVFKSSVLDITKNIFQNGYNRYLYSAVRKWLNSDKAVGEDWFGQLDHVGQVKPSNALTLAGFMAGLDEDFLAVINPTKIQVATNYVTGDGVTDVMYDKFWLPSVEEIFGVPQADGVEGAYFSYWKKRSGLTTRWNYAVDGRKIVSINSTSAQNCWLRSANLDYSFAAWNVGTSGALSSPTTSGAYRLAPACVIC